MKNRFMQLVGLTMMLIMMGMIGVQSIAAQSLDLTGLVDDVFEQANTWIPVFGPILAIGGAITIAILLVGLIISKIVQGIKGATGGR